MEIEEAREVLELDPAKEKNAARLGKFGGEWLDQPRYGSATSWRAPVTGADGKPPIPRGSRTPPETVNAPELIDDGKKILKLVLAPHGGRTENFRPVAPLPNRTMNANTPQPAPIPRSTRPIWEMVIEDMRARISLAARSTRRRSKPSTGGTPW